MFSHKKCIFRIEFSTVLKKKKKGSYKPQRKESYTLKYIEQEWLNLTTFERDYLQIKQN